MAWFKCGGGGIPTALKNSMNTVLNKKFGTTGQNYPPAGWPDDVNLLGPLPVKTASGAVVAFSDGADDVSLKSASFGIVASGGGGTPSTPVPIVGVSSVDVVHGGKNLISNSASAWESGTINSSGVNASGTGTRTIGYFELKGGATITVSGIVAPSTTSDFRIFYYDKNKDFLSYRNYSASYIVPDDVCYIRIRNVSVDDISALQIEYGSTATTYAPYVAPTTHTANLGQTVYGGTLAEDGTLTVTYKRIKVSDYTWTRSQEGNRYYFTCTFDDKDNGEVLPLLCDMLDYAGYATISQMSDPSISQWNNGTIRIYDSTVTNITQFTTKYNDSYIAYPLATPIVITGLDEISISTYLGGNTIWADTGDTECEYYADIDLALQAVSGNRGLMMSSLRSAEPIISEKSDSEEIQEETPEEVDQNESNE